MSDYKIPCLVPDLPDPVVLQPLLAEVHAKRWYTNFGPLSRRFEAEMASFLSEGQNLNLSVGAFSSATAALELVLRAMELPKGSRVLIPALTFPATALAVINAGLEPVLADVDAENWCLTPEIALNAHNHASVDVVLPVAAFGRPLELEAWQLFQAEIGVPVIFDAAAALGQQQASSDLTMVFSLHATKPFGVGEGGLVVTSDEELLAKAQSLSNFGFRGSAGVVQAIGSNAKFGEYYAAVGLAQLARWQDVQARRQRVLEWYQTHLERIKAVSLQKGVDAFVPAVMSIFVAGHSETLMQRFTEASIQTRRWYTPLLHRHVALKNITAASGDTNDLVVANRLEKGLIGLPFHAFLTEDDIAEVCSVLKEAGL